MSSFVLTSFSGLILFVMGYYFGHQIGSTSHIRKQLAKIRSSDRD